MKIGLYCEFFVGKGPKNTFFSLFPAVFGFSSAYGDTKTGKKPAELTQKAKTLCPIYHTF
jgi:hypothetical protein